MEHVNWEQVLEEVQEKSSTDVADAAAFLVLTDLLNEPVNVVKRLDTVGRFALLEYEPVNALDPDIIIMLPETAWGRVFNRAVLALQRHREAWNMPPTQWYQQARRLLVHVEAALGKVAPSPRERRFVMAWATMVVVKRRVIPPASFGAWV